MCSKQRIPCSQFNRRMKTIDSEEKKLQRNANQRRRYPQLSQERRAIVLEKKRMNYAAKKRPMPIESNTHPAKMAHTYDNPNKGLTIKDSVLKTSHVCSMLPL